MTHWLDERVTQEEADDLYSIDPASVVVGIVIALTMLALAVGLS